MRNAVAKREVAYSMQRPCYGYVGISQRGGCTMASAADIPSRRLFAISMSPAEREREVPSTAGTWVGAAKVTNEHSSSSHA
ncbi:hypothetical protein FQZ97_1074130 [compost metagenome]|jgi:hypothetical protein